VCAFELVTASAKLGSPDTDGNRDPAGYLPTITRSICRRVVLAYLLPSERLGSTLVR
jgi:hypothetical protein